VRLERPVLLDLNDATPLTLRVEGVPREAIAEVRCATAACAPCARQAGVPLFRLAHDRDQALPRQIGLAPPNTDNHATLGPRDQDTDFPGLSALVHFQDGRVQLLLGNRSRQPLTHVRVTYRLPLAWREGVVRHRLKDVKAGGRGEDSFAPTPATEDYKYHSGCYFIATQIDFVQGDEPGRLHVACEAPHAEIDRSYPQGGFVRLGPIPREELDLGPIVADLKAGKIGAQPWVLPDDTRLEWRDDDTPFRTPFLDAEFVRLSGAWAGQNAVHVLQSVLHSPQAQSAELRFPAGQVLGAVLNGEEFGLGARVQLRAGENRLALVVADAVGMFLRVLDPDTQERLTGIRFEALAPTVAEPAVYAPAAAGALARKTLAGKWRAKLTVKLPPAPSLEAPHPDNGLGAEAKQLVAAEADDSSWPELEAPRRWSEYGGDWAKVDGEAVFRRVVDIPPEWAGKDLTLWLGPVDDFDDTFWNGALVGRTDRSVPEFYSVPRRYVVPAALVKAGRNVLAVRVFDHFGEGGFTGVAGDMLIAPKAP
jgi:hypothetical protein